MLLNVIWFACISRKMDNIQIEILQHTKSNEIYIALCGRHSTKCDHSSICLKKLIYQFNNIWCKVGCTKHCDRWLALFVSLARHLEPDTYFLKAEFLYCVIFACNICFINLIACRQVDSCWQFSTLKHLHENSVSSYRYKIASISFKSLHFLWNKHSSTICLYTCTL